jgi:hypothetical protein
MCLKFRSAAILAALAGFISGVCRAQDTMPGMKMDHGSMQHGEASDKTSTHAAAGPEHGAMMMSSTTDIHDPMAREGSGTSWLPDSTPMYGKMIMGKDSMTMLHGVIHPRYVHVGSKRGDSRVDAPSWFMAMNSRRMGPKDQLGLRAMVSLDPVIEHGFGYPLLFATGETWNDKPLHDRQHPHDLFDELSATWSHALGAQRSVSLYAAYPGEPALGPPTFMHRPIAYEYPDAPVAHHWQDATHIQFGVATAGLRLSNQWKVEASAFTGREPDENRYDFDKPRFDSTSGRLSWNPDANNALQVSQGEIKNPEGDGADVRRTTASWLYNRPLGPDANFSTTLVWGQNNGAHEGRTNSYLAEAVYQRGADSIFSRIENVKKSGHELVLAPPLEEGKYDLQTYVLGYVRDLRHGKGIDIGVGGALTVNRWPSSLNPVYGSARPLSYEVFVRVRPSRM